MQVLEGALKLRGLDLPCPQPPHPPFFAMVGSLLIYFFILFPFKPRRLPPFIYGRKGLTPPPNVSFAILFRFPFSPLSFSMWRSAGGPGYFFSFRIKDLSRVYRPSLSPPGNFFPTFFLISMKILPQLFFLVPFIYLSRKAQRPRVLMLGFFPPPSGRSKGFGVGFMFSPKT